MTVGKGARDGILETRECRVGLERVAQRLRASCADVVAFETANERTNTVSKGLDTKTRMRLRT